MQKIEKPSSLSISSELQQQMQAAGSHEEIVNCWDTLQDWIKTQPEAESDTERATRDILERSWGAVNSSHSGACDTPIKYIFDTPDLKEGVIALGIPLHFLLHSVRVGALVDQLRSIQTHPEKSYPLVQPWDDDMSGYNWADEQLSLLQQENAEKKATAQEVERVALKTKKEAVISDIQAHMREPGYEMNEEHQQLLKGDFSTKLKRWKAFLDPNMGHPVLQPFTNGEFSKQEITAERYQQFKQACEADPKINSDRIPFEIINPDSGWFYVLIKNKTTQFGEFFSAAVSNMNSWFTL